MQRDSAEVRKAGFRTDRGLFWDLDGNLVTFVLVRECFDVRQRSSNTAFGMLLVVAKFCGLQFSSCRFTFHISLDLFHPLHLSDFFQLNVEGYPGASHLWVYFAQASFSYASAGAVAHEFRTLGFE